MGSAQALALGWKRWLPPLNEAEHSRDFSRISWTIEGEWQFPSFCSQQCLGSQGVHKTSLKGSQKPCAKDILEWNLVLHLFQRRSSIFFVCVHTCLCVHGYTYICEQTRVEFGCLPSLCSTFCTETVSLRTWTMTGPKDPPAFSPLPWHCDCRHARCACEF